MGQNQRPHCFIVCKVVAPIGGCATSRSDNHVIFGQVCLVAAAEMKFGLYYCRHVTAATTTNISAVNISRSTLVGKPYGGTGILYKKSLATVITPLETFDPRITAVVLKTVYGPALIVCVYMPTDYGDDECLENYIATRAKISSLYAESEAVHFIVAGDLNCHNNSRFYVTLNQFVSEHCLVISDLTRLTDAFTYSNEALNTFTWIDHILCGSTFDILITDCHAHYKFISSDHKPLSVVFENIISSSELFIDVESSNNTVLDWSNVDQHCIYSYQHVLDSALKDIDIPGIVLENDNNTNITACVDKISQYYELVISCIQVACYKTIPKRVCASKSEDYVVSG